MQYRAVNHKHNVYDRSLEPFHLAWLKFCVRWTSVLHFPLPKVPGNHHLLSVFWLLFLVLWALSHPKWSVLVFRAVVSLFVLFSLNTLFPGWLHHSIISNSKSHDFEITQGSNSTELDKYGLFFNWITMHHLLKEALYEYIYWHRCSWYCLVNKPCYDTACVMWSHLCKKQISSDTWMNVHQKY